MMFLLMMFTFLSSTNDFLIFNWFSYSFYLRCFCISSCCFTTLFMVVMLFFQLRYLCISSCCFTTLFMVVFFFHLSYFCNSSCCFIGFFMMVVLFMCCLFKIINCFINYLSSRVCYLLNTVFFFRFSNFRLCISF